jgi:hypothetical protein
VTQPLSDIDVSRRRLRVFLANRAIALGWALKGYCKPCAHRLFTIAKWLVPSVQRFLLHRTGSRNRNRRIFEFAVDLGTLLSRTYPGRVLAGFVIVVVFLGSLDLAVRATATHPQPLEDNSAFEHESGTSSGSKVVSVSKSSQAMHGFVLETGSLSGRPIPLPRRKPERVSKAQNGKGVKANTAIQKRMAQQKRVHAKPMR